MAEQSSDTGNSAVPKSILTTWTNTFLQRHCNPVPDSNYSTVGSSTGSIGGGMDSEDKTIPDSNLFRVRSGSWNAWKLALIKGGGHRRQKTVSESSDTSNTSGGVELNAILESIKARKHQQGQDPDQVPPASPLLLRTKSEVQTRSRHRSESKDSQGGEGLNKNLSFGNSDQVLYDIDGKFPYSYHETKPTFYDIDGIHRYK